MKNPFCLVAFLVILSLPSYGQDIPILQEKLEKLISDFPGEVGIAMVYDRNVVCVNCDSHFPMFSVVKFHQALAVCEKLREKNIPDIIVEKKNLKPNTWSPMRVKYPKGGKFSVNQLLEYTLIESDNNACDILFNFASPTQVDNIIHNWGIKDFGIAWTEDEQHTDISRCNDNWTTPFAAVQLLDRFYNNYDTDKYSRFVWETMTKCQTGANRIPKYIGSHSTKIVHKTGTGGITPDGKVMGINDIACIILPNGQHLELAVFIKNADCTPAECEELIAKIAKICFEEINNTKQ